MSVEGSLLDRIKKLISSGGLELPVFDQTVTKLRKIAGDENVSAYEIEKLIHADQVLVAEVLRAANSAFFGGLQEIHTIRNAIVRLGTD